MFRARIFFQFTTEHDCRQEQGTDQEHRNEKAETLGTC